MSNAIDRLQSLLVADLMTREVIQISSHQTIAEAALTFSKNKVTAAPVIDEQGRCVGILSATDCLQKTCQSCSESASLEGSGHQLHQNSDDLPLHIVSTPDDSVSVYMTDAVQSVDPGASLFTAARIMCAQHIHRLVVLDSQSRPIGIISTMDIVAAMLKSFDEMDLSHQAETHT